MWYSLMCKLSGMKAFALRSKRVWFVLNYFEAKLLPSLYDLLRIAFSALRILITPSWLLNSRLVLFKFLRYYNFEKFFWILCLVTWVRVTVSSLFCFWFLFCFCFRESSVRGIYAIIGVMLGLPIGSSMRCFLVGLDLGSFNGLLTSRWSACRICGWWVLMAFMQESYLH